VHDYPKPGCDWAGTYGSRRISSGFTMTFSGELTLKKTAINAW
jgi:hypothetical protein